MRYRGEGGQTIGTAPSCYCRSPAYTSPNLGQAGAAAVAIFVFQAFPVGPWGQGSSVPTASTQWGGCAAGPEMWLSFCSDPGLGRCEASSRVLYWGGSLAGNKRPAEVIQTSVEASGWT